MRAGCGLQVGWDTICRETKASAACYGYLAGQLTNNTQATAQDKAAQLRQAVRDGWKQYRAKGKGEAAVSDPNSAASQQVCFWHEDCKCKQNRQHYGISTNPAVKQLTCRACRSRFHVKATQMPFHLKKVQRESPWFCNGCNKDKEKSDFGLKELTKGSGKRCADCKANGK